MEITGNKTRLVFDRCNTIVSDTYLKLTAEESDNIALLVTNVVIPEMNGRELAKALQTAYPELKVLFIPASPPGSFG